MVCHCELSGWGGRQGRTFENLTLHGRGVRTELQPEGRVQEKRPQELRGRGPGQTTCSYSQGQGKVGDWGKENG